MKLHIDADWCRRMAEIEGDSEISAGLPLTPLDAMHALASDAAAGGSLSLYSTQCCISKNGHRHWYVHGVRYTFEEALRWLNLIWTRTDALARIEAGTDETPQAAQPEGREPDQLQKDTPNDPD